MEQDSKTFRKLRKILIWSGVFFALYTIIGFLVLPPVVKRIAEKKLIDTLHRPVSIQKIKINPYVLSFAVHGFHLKEQQGSEDFFSFERLYVNFQIISVFRFAPIVKECSLEGPYFSIIRKGSGAYNFSDILASLKKGKQADDSAKQAEGSPAGFGFSVSNILIKNGSADISDQPMQKVHSVRDVNIGIPFISSMESHVQVFVNPSFSALINGRSFLLSGKTKPFADSFETVMNIRLENIDLPHYYAYIPVKSEIQMEQGALDVDVDVSYIEYKDKSPELTAAGEISLKNLFLKGSSGADLLKLNLLRLVPDRSNILSGDISFSEIMIDSPEINLTRNEQGEINILKLFPVSEKEGQSKNQSASRNMFVNVKNFNLRSLKITLSDAFKTHAGSPDRSELFSLPQFDISGLMLDSGKQEILAEEIAALQGEIWLGRTESGDLWMDIFKVTGDLNKTESHDQAEGTPWNATIRKFSLHKFQIKCEDLASPSGGGDLNFENFSVLVQDLSNKPDSKGNLDLSFALNQTGSVETGGSFSINPISADMDVSAKTLALGWFQPFFEDYIGIIVSDGKISASGKLNVMSEDDKEISIAWKGDAKLTSLKTLDKARAEDFLEWNSMDFNGVQFESQPVKIHIGEILLNSPQARVIVHDDGSLNLTNIFKAQATKDQKAESEKPAEEKTDEETAPLIIVDRVLLQNGNVGFTDRSINPDFSSSLDGLFCEIGGLSSKEIAKGDLFLKGNVDRHTPFEIKGKINPLKKDLFLDAAFSLKGMELGPFSPYAGKYIGRKIHKGKLSLDLKYLVEQRKIDSSNSAFIDQFELGETVESPDAISLPLDLAVALLKNREGQISLKIPVSGSLDDPEFRIGGVIVQMIMNLLAKAVTAPFALIGSMFGSEEELNYLEFEPGSSNPDDSIKKKLNTIAKALFERPGLKLDISGYVDTDKDRQAMATARLKHNIKALKIKDLVSQGKAAPGLDGLKLTPEEYEYYLRKAYQLKYPPEKMAKPKKDEKISIGDMESRLSAEIRITEDDFRFLAKGRSLAIKSYLAGEGKISSDRLFLIQPASLTPEKVEKVKESRVELAFR
ncbi:MAG TPA: DUF748 domain-containing protein [Desulfobacteraceae bacterium]|nr:DUF748 domain-containing protein [Desulfobacteraceae bacterium]